MSSVVESMLPIPPCCFCVTEGKLTAVMRCKTGQQEEISGNTDPIFYGLFIFEGGENEAPVLTVEGNLMYNTVIIMRR